MKKSLRKQNMFPLLPPHFVPHPIDASNDLLAACGVGRSAFNLHDGCERIAFCLPAWLGFIG